MLALDVETRRMVVRGLEFDVRPGTTDEKCVDEVVRRNVYFPRGKAQVNPGEVWLDLGANVGTFSVLVASQGARVVAYEPHPDNAAILRSNLELNHSEVEVREAAVGHDAAPKQVDLFICPSPLNTYRHTLRPVRGRNAITVPCVPFAEALTPDITGIKMDIEGTELPIFDDNPDWRNVRKLVFEYHFDADRSIPAFLSRMGVLGRHFTHVSYPKLPPGDRYDYYPASRIVSCWVVQ